MVKVSLIWKKSPVSWGFFLLSYLSHQMVSDPHTKRNVRQEENQDTQKTLFFKWSFN